MERRTGSTAATGSTEGDDAMTQATTTTGEQARDQAEMREERYQIAKKLAYARAAVELARIHLDRCDEIRRRS